MPYSTIEDMKKLIPEEIIIQLTDDESAGMVDQARVAEAIAQADAEIDSYCGSRFSVPFDTVPDVVKKLSVDIAIYNLYSRRVEVIPETRTGRYRNAIRQLEGISKGLISLGVDPLPEPHPALGAETNKAVDENIFSRSTLKEF